MDDENTDVVGTEAVSPAMEELRNNAATEGSIEPCRRYVIETFSSCRSMKVNTEASLTGILLYLVY